MKILIYKRYESPREGVELEEASGIQISRVTRGTREGMRAQVGRTGGSKESEQPTTSAASDLYLTFS